DKEVHGLPWRRCSWTFFYCLNSRNTVRTQMKRLSMSAKLNRLRSRLRDPQWRRYGALLLTGKMLGLALLLMAVLFINPSLFGHGNGFIGYHWFFLKGAPATYESTGVAFLAVWLFQFAFADTCSTITSGSMIGRTAFLGDLLYSVAVSGFIYPIIGHWTWGPD